MEYKFPDNFKWGSATSAYQVEGNNHNDWSSQCRPPRSRNCLFVETQRRLNLGTNSTEHQPRHWGARQRDAKPCIPCAGKACDSYNRYEEDFDIAKNLNHNIHRFSIEWSRIEPKEGKFDHEVMHHYVNVVKALRARGLEPMVTLWHFTNPVWFADKGGWLNEKSPEIFTRYIKYIVDNLRDRVGLWITFNEAVSIYSTFAHQKGLWPPHHKNIFEFIRVRRNFIKAQALAYRTIKEVYTVPQIISDSEKSMSHNVEIGLVESNSYNIYGNRWYEKIIGKRYNYQRNLYFWDKALPYYDFLGLNYYHVDRRMPGSYRILPKQEDMKNEMGWETYPEGIYKCLMELKRFKKPIYITENGIADGKDEFRKKFIKEHLRWVWQAIHDGADVRGYMYWSLLDNFEWAEGFRPRFGLAEVDFNTFERKIRPSALEYAKICKANQLEIDS